jgi:riboflavin synthase
MFTGLVQEVGSVLATAPHGSGLRLSIKAPATSQALALGDSIAVNGCCLTAVEVTATAFLCDVSHETLTNTNLQYARPGAFVNLECALKVGDKVGGHLLTGHVDCIAQVVGIKEASALERRLSVRFPAPFRPYIIPKGSVALNGVSLTVQDFSTDALHVMLVPYTWENTNFKHLRTGEFINLEVDQVAKDVYHQLKGVLEALAGSGGSITLEKLKELGF